MMSVRTRARGVRWGVAAVAVMICANAVHAGPIGIGEYRLGDHPDANLQPHGLRLDGLNGDTTTDWTFSFNEADSDQDFTVDMRMVISGDLDGGNGQIRIFGVLFGGLDTGNGWEAEHTNFWQVEFIYNHVGRDGDGLIVDAAFSGMNTGAMTALSPSDSFQEGAEVTMEDFAGRHDFSFRLGFGHREFDGISGWGWLTHDQFDQHVSASDWLFTATLVPVPATLWLGPATLMLVGRGRRRRTVR